LTAYELGYRRQITPAVLADTTVFYNVYDKLSTLSLMPPQLVFAPPIHAILPIATTNRTSATTMGFEAVVNWRAAPRLNLSAAYSFLYMNLDGPPSSQAIASQAAEHQSPRQQWNLRSQWDVTERLALDTTLYYVSAVQGYGIDAYWRLDTRIGWQITDALHFDVVGQDLLDRSHREFGNLTDVGATQIGRSVYGRLTWRS
jgi:outer membrane receptor protein involved in Fe transport